MARTDIQQLAYTAIRIEGGLIPAEELARLTTLSMPDQTEQTERHYGIPKGLKLRDEIARNFKIAQNLWQDFQQLRQRKDVDAYGVTVREFLTPLLRHALGYADLIAVAGIQTTNGTHHSYPIGHAALSGRLPVVMTGHDQQLDQASERFGDKNPDTGRIRRRSPYMLGQEALNASDASLWAVVSNGLMLRILRDNPSLTRPAYIEVDLEAIFTEELYADFTAFWLLAHASRFGEPGAEPADCIWEHWRDAGQQAGVTVRQNLRYQVADALRSLGTGFLRHPANAALRARLHDPEEASAAKQAFFEELLSLVYRFIFLATVEDRTDPGTGRSLIFAPEAAEEVQNLYWTGYSLTWLRERAARRSSHDAHSDLWQALSITFDGLATGQPALGLPALGGLFASEQCPLLNAAQIDNQYLLAAVFRLGYFRQPTGLTRVNYRDMGAEELGSVYESLLELVPDIQNISQPQVAKLGFVGDDEAASSKGNARKLTGSYYTPDSLVQELIKSTLEPVIEQAVNRSPAHPVEALLQLTICDPACGSGHFLLAAARRLADEVAKLRAAEHGGAPTPTHYRHALRDVVSHCIYGVDKNPMAIALTKTALWLEAYTPDRPLTFIDHHLQVGDALLGVLDPKILEDGIPDEAYAVLSGDDKTTASALKKQNKAELKSWQQVVANDLFSASTLATDANTVEHLTDDTLDGIAAKRQAWNQVHMHAQQSILAKLADTYVAAFLAPKVPPAQPIIPLSGYLWGLLNNDNKHLTDPHMAEAVYGLARSHSVFHWWLAFPHVAAQGGFSVMLGNPPWERIKLQEEEFFATRSPLVASAKNKAERALRIELLRQGLLLHTLSPDVEASEGLLPPNRPEMHLYEEFIQTRRGAEAASLFAHASGRYPLTGVGDVNTYALFAEAMLQLTAPTGNAGFIVPTGIATDDSTKKYFEAVTQGKHLAALYAFENEEFVFPAVHHAMKFCLVVAGGAASSIPAAEFVHFARQVHHIYDEARRFTLTPDEFRLINPNTRTCPVFRSQRDAELTKKLYRAAPVLIREAVVEGEGKDAVVSEQELNSWGIRFSTMFHMSNDSHLFADQGGEHRLPLYEAKMIHQFDHRWATYVDNPNKPNGLDTEDVTANQKAVTGLTVRPRYWVNEREVLARIARVPTRVANAWLALHEAIDTALRGNGESNSQTIVSESQHALTMAVASWVAGALFRRGLDATGLVGQKTVIAKESTGCLFGESGLPTGATEHVASTEVLSAKAAADATQYAERELAERFPILADKLKSENLTGRKALASFQKWAQQDDAVQGLGLGDTELTELEVLQRPTDDAKPGLALQFLDAWMDLRSPTWLLGYRRITSATNERTCLLTVLPRAAVGDSVFLMSPGLSHQSRTAALIANLLCLPFDYICRQKVGGLNFNFYLMKQLPVLPPDRYTPADLTFIVPRVLELTYTASDVKAWADDLLATFPDANLPPLGVRNSLLPPFSWDPERRAILRAELDAYYAHLYGLTRDELRYVLEPADVMGEDYPSETFRVLKNNEIREFGEYRTRRLVLDAWDRLDAIGWRETPAATPVEVQYSSIGVIQSAEEAKFAGLVAALVGARPQDGITTAELQSVVARLSVASEQLDAADAQRLAHLLAAADWLQPSEILNRVLPIVQRLEAAGVVVRERAGSDSHFFRGEAALPADVVQLDVHDELARLLLAAEVRRLAALTDNVNTQGESQRAQGM
ncbi:N-6 DNA methylase [Ralstonia pseudosolanacearum]|uniref:Eco57I restriction-modification methylase domain-containing protein n=1 Tax=Ralstonia pseudosolanacearum TaxID=1310165 RepID=UPI00267527A0|nr:N-6 DNA methylase [Ralstonia pseudosolanacearum]MDO3624181.1 N-6 DNA methylase [Ralstonia pseudosolanacearum]